MKSTITVEQADAIRAYLAMHTLPRGLGTKENACSIAAINIALTGRLTDNVPDCMSNVIGRWIIRIQDRMPDEMRNSTEWKQLLPLAAGTGREAEKKRMTVALDWMWQVVLPLLQPLADEHGYGDQWQHMTTQKTSNAAAAAADAADAADAAYTAAAAYAAADAAYTAAAAYAATDAAADAAYTAAAAYAATDAAAYTAAAAYAATDAYTAAAYTAAAADAAAYAAAARQKSAFWASVDPCSCLARMIAVA